MKTDIDRLHAFVEGKTPRTIGSGKTFASCHEAAGILSTCNPDEYIVWMIPHMQWMEHILNMLHQILTEYDVKIVKITKGTKEVFLTNGRILFIPTAGKYYHPYADYRELIGMDGYILIDSTREIPRPSPPKPKYRPLPKLEPQPNPDGERLNEFSIYYHAKMEIDYT